MSAPASSCMNCRSDGIVSTEQGRHDARGNPGEAFRNRVRFHCTKCRRVWITTLDEAELHGRFLDKARLR